MNADRLIFTYPFLYHIAEEGSWESIRKYGLLSTSALLDLFKVSQVQRTAIEARHRPKPVTLAHPEIGQAIIRDQHPLSDKKLRGLLRDGMKAEDYYRLLNGKVFFWPEPKRLKSMLGAYSEHERLVLVVETMKLLQGNVDHVSLSPINSGDTRDDTPRGWTTIAPLLAYTRTTIAEVCVDYAVRDIHEVVLLVERWLGATRLGELKSA